jgi:hypothetical protein
MLHVRGQNRLSSSTFADADDDGIGWCRRQGSRSPFLCVWLGEGVRTKVQEKAFHPKPTSSPVLVAKSPLLP